MNKADLLRVLIEDCKDKVIRPDDITLREYRAEFYRLTGLKIGDKKAAKLLNAEVETGRLIATTAINDNGKDVSVWRLKEVANDKNSKQTGNSLHRPKARRVRGLPKKD